MRAAAGGAAGSSNPVPIVPWDPALGRPAGPAELPGYGQVNEQDTMGMLAAAGQEQATRCCLTMTGQDGTAAAHACIPGRRTLAGITAGASTVPDLAAALGVRLTPIARVRASTRTPSPATGPAGGCVTR